MASQSDGISPLQNSQPEVAFYRGNSKQDSLDQTVVGLLETNQSEAAYNRTLLEKINEEMFIELLPAVVYLALLMIVGTIGNVFVIYIFSKKMKSTTQNFLFLWLAMFDVISCVIGMPSEIVDIRLYFLYYNSASCKIMRFLLTVPPIATANLLVIIAVDRYRRVCRPLHAQMELFHAKVGVGVSALVAAVFAGPAFSLYGNRTIHTSVPGINGCDCSVQDKYQGRLYPLLYEMVFGAAFVIYTTVLIVIYTRVWMETRRHRRYMRSHEINSIALSALLASDTSDSNPGTPESSRKTSLASHCEVAVNRLGDSYASAARKRTFRMPSFSHKNSAADNHAKRPQTSHWVIDESGKASDTGHNNQNGVGEDSPEKPTAGPQECPAKAGSSESLDDDVAGITDRENFNISETCKFQTDTDIVENENRIGSDKEHFDTDQINAIKTPENYDSRIENINSRAETENIDCRTETPTNRAESSAKTTDISYRKASQTSATRNMVNFILSDSPEPSRKTSRILSADISVKLRKSLKANKLTVVSVAVTVAFIMSYLPHLLLITLRTVVTDFDHHQTGYKLVLYNIFLRSYFLNSVVNIFIYSAMNTEFRSHFKRLLFYCCASCLYVGVCCFD